jgi:hypothetical protein
VNLDNFGMDTITLPGGLESKLQASIGAGFSQIMLWSKDLVGYLAGWMPPWRWCVPVACA